MWHLRKSALFVGGCECRNPSTPHDCRSNLSGNLENERSVRCCCSCCSGACGWIPRDPQCSAACAPNIYDPSKRPWKRKASVVNSCLPVNLFEYQVNKCEVWKQWKPLDRRVDKVWCLLSFYITQHARTNALTSCGFCFTNCLLFVAENLKKNGPSGVFHVKNHVF